MRITSLPRGEEAINVLRDAVLSLPAPGPDAARLMQDRGRALGPPGMPPQYRQQGRDKGQTQYVQPQLLICRCGAWDIVND